MVLAGVCFIVAALGVVLAFLTAGHGDAGTTTAVIAGAVAILALLVAAIANLRPPVVLTLDAAGYRARGRHGDGTWRSIEDVTVADGLLRFTDSAGTTAAFPLALVDRNQRAALVRDVYDRLNTAYGYRRFDPAG